MIFTVAIVIGLVFVSGARLSMADSPRTSVFISDLHMGLGKDANGAWYSTEDFRWPKALEGFLDHISQVGNGAVDLVIVGDFLELWQPPPTVSCEGPNKDYGCNLQEITEIVRAVIEGHRRELQALAAFSRKGSNCVHVIPGNHDAALVIDGIWSLVAEALESDRGCVTRAKDGTWVSEDGRVVAEHGHQIGWDPNRYGEWPSVSKDFNGNTYLRRPWGEQFVQKIFNDAEAEYGLIDNLSPLSAGVKYRVKDRGVGATAWDVARFLSFNLLETSIRQKIAILGERDDEQTPPEWDIAAARLLGSALFAGALAADDELATALADSDANKDLRDALNRLVGDEKELSDEAVLALCDQLAARKADPLCPTVRRPTLGALVEKAVSSRRRVVAPYVEKRWEKLSAMRVFVYGHTHAFETEWDVPISSRVSVSVLNDGAFQRVIDNEKFRDTARKAGMTPSEALRNLGLETLPACYTFVTIVEAANGGHTRELKAWYAPESEVGQITDVCDPRCADVGHGCS